MNAEPLRLNWSLPSVGCASADEPAFNWSRIEKNVKLSDGAKSFEQKRQSDKTSSAKSKAFARVKVDSFVPTPRKRASFKLDAHEAVFTQSFHYDQSRSEEEKAKCWSTPLEQRECQSSCRRDVFAAFKTAYTSHLSIVYEACKHGNLKKITKARAFISSSPYRGLEAIIASAMQSERYNHNVFILKTQKSLPLDMSPESREEVIAKSSTFLSVRSRRFARLLAIGDAAVVSAYEQMDALKQAGLMRS